MNILEICSISTIVALCYGLIEVLKHALKNDEKLKTSYPLISASFGAVMGTVGYLVEPSLMITDSEFRIGGYDQRIVGDGKP